MSIKHFGSMAVDWEQRIDFDRLRTERLARAKMLLEKSEMGALLCFDMNNVRYLTATHIGTWAQDKVSRFALLPQNDEPILWDFGSAARHHQQNCPWLGERSRAGIPSLRGAMTPEMGQRRRMSPRKSRSNWKCAACTTNPSASISSSPHPIRAPKTRHHRNRRPAVDVGYQRDQDQRRNPAPQSLINAGRRRLSRAVSRHAPRLQRKRSRGFGE